MKRRPILGVLVALAAAGAAALTLTALPERGSAGSAGGSFFADPGGSAEPASSGIRFNDRSSGAVVLQSPSYRLTLAKRDGAILELLDLSTGVQIVKGENGCLWGAVTPGDGSYLGGCAFTSGGPARFSYAWEPVSSTLTLSYEPDPGAARRVRAVVTIAADTTYLDLRLTLENETTRVVDLVTFPADLYANADLVDAGYAPNFLPGVRFKPSFFRRPGNNVLTYPSRWAFADYLAVDVGGAHLALYAVNPAPGPIAPVELGFIHNLAPVPCSGSTFCLAHAFETWVKSGHAWTSPVVRLRVGAAVEESIVAYRTDNGMDAYPSVAAKLGARLERLSRAPLIKADLWKGLPPFKDWKEVLERLPSPALVHPVAFQPGGHDVSDPDFLPPDPRWGTAESFRTTVDDAHALGQSVMPYLNVSWWDPESPTVQNLPEGLTATDIAVQDDRGRPAREQFGDHDGYIVSPYSPFVRQRVDALLGQFQKEVPVDCLFFDQIGARPWRRDFNPAAPTPLAYDDGWLAVMAPYTDRCLMVEDGWDRLASSFVGFHGGLMLMQREHSWPDIHWGSTSWEAFPLADWLLHDKVLVYQHDLYVETMTADPEMLAWNLAYGFMLSYNWDGDAKTLESPWLGVVGAFQKALGPHYAGAALTSYRSIADGVTETRFGDYSVVANRSKTATYAVDGYTVAPGGFLARTDDGSLVAGELADPTGPVYRIVENGQTTFSAPVPGNGG